MSFQLFPNGLKFLETWFLKGFHVTISGEYCREYTERNEKRASQHVLKMADNKKTLYSKARS